MQRHYLTSGNFSDGGASFDSAACTDAAVKVYAVQSMPAAGPWTLAVGSSIGLLVLQLHPKTVRAVLMRAFIVDLLPMIDGVRADLLLATRVLMLLPHLLCSPSPGLSAGCTAAGAWRSCSALLRSAPE